MSYSASQEVFLPTEVLLEIFKCLRRLDVEKMKTVCKYWGTIARHPALGFRLAHQFILSDAFFQEVANGITGYWPNQDTIEQVDNYYKRELLSQEKREPARLRYQSPYVPVSIPGVQVDQSAQNRNRNGFYIGANGVQQQDVNNRKMLTLFDRKGEPLCHVTCTEVRDSLKYRGWGYAVTPETLFVPSTPEEEELYNPLFDCTFEEIKADSAATNLGIQLKHHLFRGKVRNWMFTQHINLYKLEEYILLKKAPQILSHSSVTSVIQRDALKYAYSFAMPLPLPTAVLRPPIPTPKPHQQQSSEAMRVEGHATLQRSQSRINPLEDLKGLKPGAKLFKYQLNAVAWMRGMENNPFKAKYLPLVNWPISRPDIFFSMKGTGVHIHDPELDTHIFEEMGLGKTLSCIGLIMANPPQEPLPFLYGDENEKWQTDITTDMLNNRNYWQYRNVDRTLMKTKYPLYDSNPQRAEETAAFDGFNYSLFNTKATLVMCPNHLLKQWTEELTKYSTLKVIPLTTIAVLRKQTVQDIINADVVIASNLFLKNANYLHAHTGTYGVSANACLVQRKTDWLPVIREILVLGRKPAAEQLKEKLPILDLFHWHRLILDEGHEVMADPDFLDAISCLRARFRWYVSVSGTPFPSEEVAVGALRYFNWQSTDSVNFALHSLVSDENGVDHFTRYLLQDMVLHNLMWRNTKESVAEEYEVPAAVDDIQLLGTIEGDEVRMRQLCCSPQLSVKDKKRFGEDDISLEAMRQIMTERLDREALLKAREKQLEGLIATLEEEIPALQELMGMDVETDEELSEDVEIAEKKRQKALQNQRKMMRGGLSSSSSSSEEVIVEEMDEEEIDQKRKEAKAKKILRQRKRLLRAKKRKLRKTKAALETTLQRMEWHAQSRANFAALVPVDLAALKKSESEKAMAAEKEQLKEVAKTKKSGGKKPAKNALPMPIKQMTVKVLEQQLRLRGSEVTGKKAVLVEALTALVAKEKEEEIENRQAQPVKDISAWDLMHHGTKLTNAVHYVQSLLARSREARVLIFSQYPSFLKKLSLLLDRHEIKTVSVEGNIFMRDKAIASFKNAEIQVMLLSLENSASGTNLTEATHVILLDPIQGTRDESKAIENQAIGRSQRQGQQKQVTVVRFLIKGTIEHKQFLPVEEEEEEPAEPAAELKTDCFATQIANLPKMQRRMSTLAEAEQKLHDAV